MEEILWIIFAGLSAFLIAFLAYAAFWYGRLAVWYLGNSVHEFAEGIEERVGFKAYQIRRKARKHATQKWVEARIGARRSSGSVNPVIIQARMETPVLRRLVHEELPSAIQSCVRTHRFAATAAQAEYMYEIAYEPECLGLREMVVDLLEVAIDRLAKYPLLLNDETLLQNLVVLRRIVPICENCPYLEHRVRQAPLLCPSAEIAGTETEMCESHANSR